MKITLNPDKEIVNVVKEGLKRTGGYCPCVREQSEETKCMCKQFKEQVADPEFEGLCHCMLYYKSKEPLNKWRLCRVFADKTAKSVPKLRKTACFALYPLVF